MCAHSLSVRRCVLCKGATPYSHCCCMRSTRDYCLHTDGVNMLGLTGQSIPVCCEVREATRSILPLTVTAGLRSALRVWVYDHKQCYARR